MGQIVMHGFYGMGNLGDEAILTALLKIINKNMEAKITVISRNPSQVRRTHGIGSINETGQRDFARRLWTIYRSRLFLFGGGGLLKDYGKDSTSIIKWLQPVEWASRMRRKTAIVAIGVENIRYHQSKKAVCKALNKIDLITVRDRHSKIILENIGIKKKITIVSDPAILLCTAKTPERLNIKAPKVMVCVRHWYDKGHYISNQEANQKLIETMSRALDYLIENYNAQIDFCPLRTTSHDDDRVVAHQISGNMKFGQKTQIYRSVPSVTEYVRMVKRYSLVIGMRLHSLILAAASGIPVIGLNYMPKVQAFMESIQQEQCSLNPATLDIGNLKSVINRVFESHNQISETLLSQISDLQIVTEGNINKILTLAD